MWVVDKLETQFESIEFEPVLEFIELDLVELERHYLAFLFTRLHDQAIHQENINWKVERIPFISPSRTLNYSHKSHTNGESIQQINRIGLILFPSWTKPTNSYWILSTKVSNLLEKISKRNNEGILIMSNNGGMAEITHTVCMCFLMHASHWLI